MNNPNPRPNPREISKSEYTLALAESNLRKAKAEREAEERAEWKQKARQIAREARQVLQAFNAAKAEFAAAERELGKLRSKQNGIAIDLQNLNQWFKSIDMPLPEEESTFASRKQELEAELAAIYKEVFAVQQRQGIALRDEQMLNEQYVKLQYSHRNAKSKASGERLGKIEDGGIISFVR